MGWCARFASIAGLIPTPGGEATAYDSRETRLTRRAVCAAVGAAKRRPSSEFCANLAVFHANAP